MKSPAGELPLACLLLVQHRTRQPARADDAVRLRSHAAAPNRETRAAASRRRRPRSRSDPPADASLSPSMSAPPLPMGSGNSRLTDDGNSCRDALHHAERVVRQPLSTTTSLEFAVVILLEIPGIVAQHRFDAAFFVVGRNQEQQAGFGHAQFITREWPKINCPGPISHSTRAGCRISRCACAAWRG